MTDDPTAWLTVHQVSRLLQLHPGTIRRHPDLRPHAVKVGKQLRFPPDVIDRVIQTLSRQEVR